MTPGFEVRRGIVASVFLCARCFVRFGAPAVDAYLGAGVFSSRKVCLDIPQGKGAIR